MAKKNFLKGSRVWSMFMDYWMLCQNFWEPEDDNIYWEYLINETDKFYEKYATGFARILALGLVMEAERRSKNQQE